jgi:multidrug efflux pump
MTTLAMALGSLPIALGLGAASKSRVPMGVAIVGGLLFALILTLFVVPALYSWMASGTDDPEQAEGHMRTDEGHSTPAAEA